MFVTYIMFLFWLITLVKTVLSFRFDCRLPGIHSFFVFLWSRTLSVLLARFNEYLADLHGLLPFIGCYIRQIDACYAFRICLGRTDFCATLLVDYANPRLYCFNQLDCSSLLPLPIRQFVSATCPWLVLILWALCLYCKAFFLIKIHESRIYDQRDYSSALVLLTVAVCYLVVVIRRCDEYFIGLKIYVTWVSSKVS